MLFRRCWCSIAPDIHTFNTRFVGQLFHPGTQSDLIDLFSNLLQQFNVFVEHIKQIHSTIIVTGCSSSGFLVARLISTYSNFGLINEAREVFETSPIECFSNMFVWNSILRANVNRGECSEAINIYTKMRGLGVRPDSFGFPLIVRASALLDDHSLCKLVHCHTIQMGFENHLHTANELLNMYGKIGRMDSAHALFDRMYARTQLSWNIIVSGYSRNFDCDGALQMFLRMQCEGWQPNAVTWTSLLSSFSKCRRHEDVWQWYIQMRRIGVEITAEALSVVISDFANMNTIGRLGKMVQAYAMKGGFDNHSIVMNSLINLYGKNGDVEAAECLFSGLPSKNIVSWNSLLSSYAESGLCDEAFSAFSQLEKLGEHSSVRPNIISWTIVIRAFAAKGRHEECLELFRRMQFYGVLANCFTISSVLSVCADISGLYIGREIHGFVIKVLKKDANVLVQNGLINMYMKCGSLKDGNTVFDRMEQKDLFSWNILISGYGMHGQCDLALETFDRMVKSGFQPDKVSMVAILSACGHGGAVSQGREIFNQMRTRFGIEPEVEHYACVVDLLGRAGLLQEAKDLVKEMQVKPNACVWGALLNSGRMHGNARVAEMAAAQLLGLDSESQTGSFMLICNLYAGCSRWGDSANARLSAKTRGFKKPPGQSWVEVKKKVYMFSSGESTQTKMEEEMYWMLNVLGYDMGKVDYMLQMHLASQDVEGQF